MKRSLAVSPEVEEAKKRRARAALIVDRMGRILPEVKRNFILPLMPVFMVEQVERMATRSRSVEIIKIPHQLSPAFRMRNFASGNVVSSIGE